MSLRPGAPGLHLGTARDRRVRAADRLGRDRGRQPDPGQRDRQADVVGAAQSHGPRPPQGIKELPVERTGLSGHHRRRGRDLPPPRRDAVGDRAGGRPRRGAGGRRDRGPARRLEWCS